MIQAYVKQPQETQNQQDSNAHVALSQLAHILGVLIDIFDIGLQHHASTHLSDSEWVDKLMRFVSKYIGFGMYVV